MLTGERKGELAFAILKLMALEEEKEMKPEQASELVLVISEEAQKLPAELNVELSEVFDLFREIIMEKNRPVYDWAVKEFWWNNHQEEAKSPRDLLSQTIDS